MHRFGAALIAALALAGPPSYAKLIDGMAARFSGQVITVREVRFFLALQRFKDAKGDPLAPEGPGELRATAQRLLLEEMVYAELKSLKFDGGPRSESEKWLARRKGQDGKSFQRILKTYGKSEAAVVDRLWKSQQVERFIQRRVETMTPIVTEAEIDRYMRDKGQVPDKQAGADVSRLRAAAAQDLKKELMRKELEEWIVLLKRKYSVTNHLEG